MGISCRKSPEFKFCSPFISENENAKKILSGNRKIYINNSKYKKEKYCKTEKVKKNIKRTI